MTGPVVPDWSPPWPYRGDLDHRRIQASGLGAALDRTCPEQMAAKSRPEVWPDLPSDYRREPWYTFWLGLARDCVLLLLQAPGTRGERPADLDTALAETVAGAGRSPVPAPVVAAARTAAAGYLAALDRIRSVEPGWDDAVFVTEFVVSVADAPGVTEWTAWGVGVTRDGHRTREVHVLRHRDAGSRDVPDARLAATAWVAADGFVPDPDRGFADAYRPWHAQPPAPQRVVVREVSVLDSQDHVLLDVDAGAARAIAARDVPPAMAVLAGGPYLPGSRCASCRQRRACPGPPRIPGLLGVAARAGWTRVVTPGDLTAHAICPRRVHLRRDLGLPPAGRDPGPAAVRGIAVHRWLEAAHARGRGCDPHDLPESGGGALAVDLAWTPHEEVAVRPWLQAHLDHCPLPGAVDVRTEVDVTVWDTDADIVLTTRIDLAFRRPGVGRVLRETKTVSPRTLPERESELIEMFPQVAFAIVCLAAGHDPVGTGTQPPTTVEPGLVELELLDVDGGTVVPFDPTDPDTVLAARVVLADAVDRRITDVDHVAAPGPRCRWCDMRDHCDARPVGSGAVAAAGVGAVAPIDLPGGAQVAGTGLGLLDLIAAATPQRDPDDVPF